MVHLESVCDYVSERVPFAEITSEDYITTDNMLQKRRGVVAYKGNPISGNVVRYKKGDILISNIRPYLQKIWFADKDGGCSADVLVFRSKNQEKILPEYLLACLNADEFFDFVMEGKSGVKMPRGDKDRIMRYPIKDVSVDIQKKIVEECATVDADDERNKSLSFSAKRDIDDIVSRLLSQKGSVLSLDDESRFSLSIGKRVVDAQLRANGRVPVMSANVFEPMGMIDEELLSDYSVDSVIWGIDGDWMVNVWPATKPFYPTDHCGVLRVKTDEAISYVVARLLERAGRQAGFKRSNRASIERVKALKIAVPSLEEQRKAVKKIEKLEAKIAEAEAELSKSASKKAAILDKYLSMRDMK